jgi:hypothetical protein
MVRGIDRKERDDGVIHILGIGVKIMETILKIH